jgi:spore photoproduct lyase
MIRHIYVERAVAEHPRARAVLGRFPKATVVPCGRYGEVFNRRGQDFRLQKRSPGLILAAKHDHFLLETPASYGVGGRHNYYFSHLLNCIYDCRYCFLQGMYRSASYVLFVNYEQFQAAIDVRLAAHRGEDVWFFSGYDSDSLALERVTDFGREFLPFFAARPSAWLELRTKSVQIAPFLAGEVVPNCVVAFSFTPPAAHRELEHGVPSVERRLAAMERLALRGWKIGLRFDPLLASSDYREAYRALFASVFRRIPGHAIHSVSLGPFRLPRGFYDTLYRLYPEEPLLAGPLAAGKMVSYPVELERELIEFCTEELERWVDPAVFFPCVQPAGAGAAAQSPA